MYIVTFLTFIQIIFARKIGEFQHGIYLRLILFERFVIVVPYPWPEDFQTRPSHYSTTALSTVLMNIFHPGTFRFLNAVVLLVRTRKKSPVSPALKMSRCSYLSIKFGKSFFQSPTAVLATADNSPRTDSYETSCLFSQFFIGPVWRFKVTQSVSPLTESVVILWSHHGFVVIFKLKWNKCPLFGGFPIGK